MSTYIYVYVGEHAEANFRIGLEKMVWGWKTPYSHEATRPAAQLLENPTDDTYLVFAQEPKRDPPWRGWPRTKRSDGPGPWRPAVMRSMTIAQVAGPLFTGEEGIWSDALYPYRIPLCNIVSEPAAVALSLLSDDAIMAIRESGVSRAGPVRGPEPFDDAVKQPPAESVTLAPDGLLSGLEGLNGYALTLVRREQSRLRAIKLKNATKAQCSLCHRDLPAGLLRLAHIKKRSMCSPEECLDPGNTMWACTLGCDELFERGYISVHNGKVVAGSGSEDWTDSLDSFIDSLLGIDFVEYSMQQELFFEWHRDAHGIISG